MEKWVSREHRPSLFIERERPTIPFTEIAQRVLSFFGRIYDMENTVWGVRTMDVIRILQQNVETMQKVIKMLSGVPVKKAAKTAEKLRHKMSAAGRKRIAAAQRARWAKVRAAKK